MPIQEIVKYKDHIIFWTDIILCENTVSVCVCGARNTQTEFVGNQENRTTNDDSYNYEKIHTWNVM